MSQYDLIKMTVAVIATLGLYSVLYRENKFYRFWEHTFLGLAAGWALVALWTETLKANWWDKMVGRVPEAADPGTPGFWAWILLLPIGILGYFVFSKKHAWLARIPIGIIIGLWAGQQFNAWLNRFWPQINSSMLPIWPTNWDSITVPNLSTDTDAATRAIIDANVYPTEAVSNLIAVITILSVLTYFLFSFELKTKFLRGTTKLGRYLLMVGFGAIFGSTVMMRFTLLIDRMYFIWIEWLQKGIIEGLLRGGGGGGG